MKKIIAILLLSISIIYADSEVKSKSTMQAIGYGNSEDEALKSAYQNAVEQYVGVLVDSSTIIRNDQLIKNDILTFSNGYIESYKKLSSKEQMGLWEVKIDAIIKKQNVLEKIKALNIDPIDIKDSEQTYAKVVSQVKSKFDAEDMLVKLVKETVSDESLQRYTTLRIDNVHLNIDEATRKYVPVTINYSVTINWDEYNKMTNKFEKLFENIGGKLVSSKEMKDYVNHYAELAYYESSSNELENDLTIRVVVKRNNKLYDNVWQFPKSFAVIYPFQESSHRWIRYKNDKDTMRVYEHKYEDHSPHMQIHPYSLSMVNANKQTIWSNNKSNEHPANRMSITMNDLFRTSSEYTYSGHLMIFPRGLVSEDDNSAIFKKSKVLNIDIDKLKDLKQVKLSWDK